MKETRFLTIEQVLFIHKRMIDETGGMRGVRDVKALQSAVARPQATFDGEALYPDIFAMAAALMESIILNHPFFDANKRTGLTAGAIFLRLNDHQLAADPDLLERFIMEIARGQHDVDSIAAWLRAHT